MSRSYRHIKEYEKEILQLKEQGLTKKDIGIKLGFSKDQIHNFFSRYNETQRRVSAGIALKKRGRPSKDSIVRIKCFVRERGMLDSNDLFALYSNAAMVSPILEQDFGSTSNESDDFMQLEEGTYYLKYTSELDWASESDHNFKFLIGAMPQDNPVWVEQTASADRKKMTIKVTPKFAGVSEVSEIRWEKGKDADINSMFSNSATADSQRSFTVDKNGWYTVCINVDSTVAFNNGLEYIFNVEVKGIGAGAKKGVTYTVNNVKYKVVKAGFDGTGTVMVTGMKKAKSSVTIPNMVNIGNHDYQVVKINKKAFYKQYKLKKITIKATGIKSIGKNAFKSINPKATFTVPKKSYSQYKKMLKASTGFKKKTMKIKKK
jgi:hypothetical protein